MYIVKKRAIIWLIDYISKLSTFTLSYHYFHTLTCMYLYNHQSNINILSITYNN